MWKRLSILAIALSLIAPPIVVADNKPGKPAPTHIVKPKMPKKPNTKGDSVGTARTPPTSDTPINAGTGPR
jgi:hypothetical protein